MKTLNRALLGLSLLSGLKSTMNVLRVWLDPGFEGNPYAKNVPSQLDGNVSFSFKFKFGKKFAA